LATFLQSNQKLTTAFQSMHCGSEADNYCDAFDKDTGRSDLEAARAFSSLIL